MVTDACNQDRYGDCNHGEKGSRIADSILTAVALMIVRA